MQIKPLPTLASAPARGERSTSPATTPSPSRKLAFAPLGAAADRAAQRLTAPHAGFKTDGHGDRLAAATLMANNPRADRLRTLLNSPKELQDLVSEVFGTDLDAQLVDNVLARLKNAFFTGDWSFLKVRLVDDNHPAVAGGALAAYTGGDDRMHDCIFIARSTLGDKEQLQASFFEELGHWIDDQLRAQGGDAMGDEGERFSDLLSATKPREGALIEDDRRTVTALSGKRYQVENKAANYPSDAEWMAAQYQLLMIWKELPTKDGKLDHTEFVQQIFKTGNPSHPRFDQNLAFFSTPAFKFLKDLDNWKKYSGGNSLTFDTLWTHAKNSVPSEAERLRAWHELNENWAAATVNGDQLTKKELIDALKPGSAFYKKKLAREIAAIDRAFVYFYKALETPLLSRAEVVSRIRLLKPSLTDLELSLYLLVANWPLAIGSSSVLTPPLLRAAMNPTSDFGKKLTDSQRKVFNLVAEYWLQQPTILFGSDQILTFGDLQKEIDENPVKADIFPTGAEWTAAQYQLLNIWEKLQKKDGKLDHAEFLKQVFKGDNPNHPSLDPNLNFLSTPALNALKDIRFWKQFTGGEPLTLQKLKDKINGGKPINYDEAFAWNQIYKYWNLVTGKGKLTRKELIDAMKPSSAFYKKLKPEVRADIDQVFVYLYQSFGTKAISKEYVLSKINSFNN
jgi:hypothetical protein